MDQAMMSKAQKAITVDSGVQDMPGGIDLNAEHFDLEIKSSDGAMMASKIKIDPQSIHGLVPEIILIKSVPWPALFEKLR